MFHVWFCECEYTCDGRVSSPCGQCASATVAKLFRLQNIFITPSLIYQYNFRVTGVLEQVIAKCIPDASAREICEFGDKLILEETSKVFKKEKDSKKGIAFSTCVSVNNCICHFSPIPSEADYILKQGDLAKMWVNIREVIILVS